MRLRLMIAACTATLLAGCGTTHELIKDIEDKAYNSLAKAFSQYCDKVPNEGAVGDIAKLERIELRREIRQRGHSGPKGPGYVVAGLDDQTANGPGPVIYVACTGDPVPEDLWLWMVRDWR